MKLAKPRGAQRGFALLLVLWLGVMVSVMAASFAFSARTEARIGRSALARAQADFLADAAVKRAALGLTARSSEQRFRADGREYRWRFAGADLRISISPESAKLDINRAPEAMVRGLFDVLADDEIIEEGDVDSLTESLLDFIDSDRNRRTHGAERSDYSRAGRPHGAADRKLLAVSELGQVLGMNARIIERIGPLVTVYARTTRIDGMTAPRELLRAVPGVTLEQVDEFLAARARIQAEMIEADETDAGQLTRTTRGAGGPTSGDSERGLRSGRRRAPVELLGEQARRYVSRSSGRVYALRIRGRAAGGTPVSRDAVVRVPGRGGSAYSLLTWSPGGLDD